MQRYVAQLIEDLKEAALKSPVSQQFSYASGNNNGFIAIESLEKLFDFPLEKLPDPELLNSQQLQTLSDTILDLLTAYNLYTILPNDLPPAEKYQLLRNTWRQEGMKYSPYAFHKIDFCRQTPHQCLFKEHCFCRETEEDVQKRYGLN